MSAFLVPDDGSGRIFIFDAIESAIHESVVDVTEHPVEVGVTVTDHVRPTPVVHNFIAILSNQPIRRDPFTQRGEVVPLALDIPENTTITTSVSLALQRALSQPPSRTAQTLQFAEPFDIIRELYEAMLDLQQSATLCQIVTDLRAYDDMQIVRLSAPVTTGDSSVSFAIDARQLRIVESGTVAAPPTTDVPGGKPLQNKGAQGKKDPKGDGKKPGSIAFQILQSQGIL